MTTGACCRAGFWLLLLVALSACGDPVERHIAQLVEGGEEAEEAKIELNLAKSTAIIPLVEAFQNPNYPSRARVDIAQALYRLYLREEDERILNALTDGLEDADVEVRAGATRAVGDLRKPEGVDPLIRRLAAEASDRIRYEILHALETMGLEGREVRTRHMAEAEKTRFTGLLVEMAREDLPDSLRRLTFEWLEVLAEEKAGVAQELLLKADLQGSEEVLLAARELIPDSKNINQKLGRFYYDNGDPERGIEYLAEQGMVARVPELKARPNIDGVLEEPAWEDVAPLTEFYQCIWKMRAYRIEGEAEAYVGYLNDNFYLAVKGYEASTDNLAAASTERDADRIAHDDCVEIFLDTDHDYRTYYHVMINSLGTVQDRYNDGTRPFGDTDWNGTYELATRVEPTYWTVEIEIPAGQLHGTHIQRGDVWGFNVARVRIANASEYGQWVPTYGFAHRPGRLGFLLFD